VRFVLLEFGEELVRLLDNDNELRMLEIILQEKTSKAEHFKNLADLQKEKLLQIEAKNLKPAAKLEKRIKREMDKVANYARRSKKAHSSGSHASAKRYFGKETECRDKVVDLKQALSKLMCENKYFKCCYLDAAADFALAQSEFKEAENNFVSLRTAIETEKKRILDEKLATLAQVGISPEYVDNFKTVTDGDSINFFYGGKDGRPDGIDHNHLSMDVKTGKITYHRLPGSKHGPWNFVRDSNIDSYFSSLAVSVLMRNQPRRGCKVVKNMQGDEISIKWKVRYELKLEVEITDVFVFDPIGLPNEYLYMSFHETGSVLEKQWRPTFSAKNKIKSPAS